MKQEKEALTIADIESMLPDILREHDFDFPAELLPVQFNEANIAALYEQSKKIMGMVIKYKKLMMMYNCALKQIRTKFEILGLRKNR